MLWARRRIRRRAFFYCGLQRLGHRAGDIVLHQQQIGDRVVIRAGPIKLVHDEKDLANSSVTVEIPLDRLRTGVDALGEQLKKEEVRDAAQYPGIGFTSAGTEKGPMNTLKITGNLSVHGVTRPVVLNGKINKISMDPATKKSRAGFDAGAVLRRSDFGVGKCVPSVADELHVRITLEAGG